MTDRELLELAAKAAGKYGVWDGSVFVLDSPGPTECSAWDPISDDGDALRLAVDLCITPEFQKGKDSVFTGYETIKSLRRTYHSPIIEKFNGDPYAATRRAIVRAAAEIGRAMQ